MEHPPSCFPPSRVLVVEDYEDARQSLHMVLGMWGYVCESAPTGEVALEIVPAFRPDVVLMDIGLPGMDGYRLARELRAAGRVVGPVRGDDGFRV